MPGLDLSQPWSPGLPEFHSCLNRSLSASPLGCLDQDAHGLTSSLRVAGYPFPVAPSVSGTG